MGCSYTVFRFLIRFLLSIRYRRIFVFGEENIKPGVPVVISGTHTNMYLDAAVLVYAIKRPIGFLVAAVTAKKGILKPLMSFLNMISVDRPSDHAYRGQGTIVSVNDRIVEGEGTRWKTDLKDGFGIRIDKATTGTLVTNIISDTKIELKYKPRVNFKQPCGYSILPKISQRQVFKAVYEMLQKDKAVALFPEGRSHDRTFLLPLKPGACVFVYGSQQHYNKKVQMVEIGLNYFGEHRFRSKVIVDIGKPRSYEFDQDLMGHANYKQENIDKMMEDLKNSLEKHKICVPTYNEQLNLYIAKEVYLEESNKINRRKDFKIYRKFADGYNLLKNKPEIMRLRKEIEQFRQQLKRYHLKVRELNKINKLFGLRTILYFIKFIFAFIIVS